MDEPIEYGGFRWLPMGDGATWHWQDLRGLQRSGLVDRSHVPEKVRTAWILRHGIEGPQTAP